MNSLMLCSTGGVATARRATWAIESPTPGVVLIDVDIGESKSLVPLHWRAGDWTKPPLDIEINPADSTIQGVQFVLQDERVPFGAGRPIDGAEPVMAMVDVSAWPASRYRDVRCPVHSMRVANEFVIAVGATTGASHTGVAGSFLLGWDMSGCLCEIRLGPLRSEDWEDIDAFSRGGKES
jgi:hypothetical protein